MHRTTFKANFYALMQQTICTTSYVHTQTVQAQTLTCKEERNCDLVATKPVTSILLAVGVTTKFTSDTSTEDP